MFVGLFLQLFPVIRRWPAVCVCVCWGIAVTSPAAFQRRFRSSAVFCDLRPCSCVSQKPYYRIYSKKLMYKKNLKVSTFFSQVQIKSLMWLMSQDRQTARWSWESLWSITTNLNGPKCWTLSAWSSLIQSKSVWETVSFLSMQHNFTANEFILLVKITYSVTLTLRSHCCCIRWQNSNTNILWLFLGTWYTIM